MVPCWSLCVCPSIVHSSVSLFVSAGDDNKSISVDFTKLGMHFDTMEICLSIASWQILSIFDTVICQQHDSGSALPFHVFFFVFFFIAFMIQITQPHI